MYVRKFVVRANSAMTDKFLEQGFVAWPWERLLRAVPGETSTRVSRKRQVGLQHRETERTIEGKHTTEYEVYIQDYLEKVSVNMKPLGSILENEICTPPPAPPPSIKKCT